MKRIICKIIVIVTFVTFLCTVAYAGTKTKKIRMQEETVEPCPLSMEETVEAFPFIIGDDHSPSMKDYPQEETVEPCPFK